ncbi:hypothetical protein RHD99_06540 [Buttiauxella selenatireducens]|uniref:MORN repeat variant n=1 Tax=Buttiauxella selenatireducens TaxID=3073902 RepID=A0ABY9SFH8_9ENTR|nr:hypothetical protein [Buttiauxella sp. R73]WMY75600.1 hypothetical protein RHD99_06540 [Buttiauxella sp. R73]
MTGNRLSRRFRRGSILLLGGLLSTVLPWPALATQETGSIEAVENGASSAPAAPSGEALLQSKPVHGPLTLPDSEERSVLGFYQQGETTYALFSRPDYQDDSQTYHDVIDSFTDARIVAVFFQDLDGGNRDEVVVMYEDKQGQHLRAYAASGGSYSPLAAMQAKLDTIAPALKPFTVASSRKALRALQPQDYRISYDLPADSPPEIQALLRGQLASPAQPVGYADEQGNTVKNAASALFAITRYPELTRSVTTADGQVLTYVLTQILARIDMCQDEELVFGTWKVAYMRADKAPVIFESAPEASPKPDYDGPWMQFSVNNCYALPQIRGNYAQGKRQGHWEFINTENSAVQESGDYVDDQRQGMWSEWDVPSNSDWRGQYKDNLKEGLWLLSTDSQPPVVLAWENYRNGQLNGPTERYELSASTTTQPNPLSLLYKGEYRDGKKAGHWAETHGDKREESEYLDGVLHGVQKSYNADNVLIRQSTYQQGLLEGEERRFYPSGQLAEITRYVQDQPNGEQFFFYDGKVKTGPLSQLKNWKQIAPKNPKADCDPQDRERCTPAGKPRAFSLLSGEQREYAENGRLTRLYFQTGETKVGNAYGFTKSGQLNSVTPYVNGKEQGVRTLYSTGTQQDDNRLIQVLPQWDNRVTGVSYGFDSSTDSLRAIEQACQKPDETYAGRPYRWSNAGAACGSQFYFHPNGRLKRITWKDSNWDINEISYGADGALASEQRYAGSNVFFNYRYMWSYRTVSITKQESPDTRTEKGRTFAVLIRSPSQTVGYEKSYSNGRLLDESFFTGADKYCWRRYAKDGSVERSKGPCDGLPLATQTPVTTPATPSK